MHACIAAYVREYIHTYTHTHIQLYDYTWQMHGIASRCIALQSIQYIPYIRTRSKHSLKPSWNHVESCWVKCAATPTGRQRSVGTYTKSYLRRLQSLEEPTEAQKITKENLPVAIHVQVLHHVCSKCKRLRVWVESMMEKIPYHIIMYCMYCIDHGWSWTIIVV